MTKQMFKTIFGDTLGPVEIHTRVGHTQFTTFVHLQNDSAPIRESTASMFAVGDGKYPISFFRWRDAILDVPSISVEHDDQ